MVQTGGLIIRARTRARSYSKEGEGMTYTLTPKDYLIEVQKGNVPGHSLSLLSGTTDEITTTEYTDISPIATSEFDTPFATASETLEIVSDSTDDDAGGIGALTVALFSLNDQYEVQAPTIVALNGLTPVVLAGTHFRIIRAFILTTGTNTTNVGNLLIRVAGGGDDRVLIKARIGTGQTGTYTVPAGVTAFLQDILITTPKNNDVNFRSRIRDSTVVNAAERSGGDQFIYQSLLYLIVKASFRLTTGFDFRLQAISNNENTKVTYQGTLLVVENEFLP